MRTALTPFLLALTLTMFVAASARAQSIQVVSVLNGGDITPNRVLTGAFAIAELTVDSVKGEIAYTVDTYNLPSGVTAAHIHVGGVGMVGPVLFDLRPTPGQSGDFKLRGTLSVADLATLTTLGIRDVTDALESVIGFATYIDIHTTGRPEG